MLRGAASDGALPAVTAMSTAELVGWLREIVYTDQETIAEVERTADKRPEPYLRVLDKPAS